MRTRTKQPDCFRCHLSSFLRKKKNNKKGLILYSINNTLLFLWNSAHRFLGISLIFLSILLWGFSQMRPEKSLENCLMCGHFVVSSESSSSKAAFKEGKQLETQLTMNLGCWVIFRPKKSYNITHFTLDGIFYYGTHVLRL